MTTIPLYQAIARKLAWDPPADSQFIEQRAAYLARYADMLPHGSGMDAPDRYTFTARKDGGFEFDLSYHHMNDVGYYVGWTDHTIIVRSSLQQGFELKITGRDRNEIKDYLHETFDYALRQMVDEYPGRTIEQPMNIGKGERSCRDLATPVASGQEG